jgi:uncharacterized membrane protein YeaQ/YmgE (transglycosylase-associated protein family)
MQTTLSAFITDLQGGSIISFFAWIFLGGLVGFIGGKIVNKTGHGLVRDVLLSIFGAIFGGFLVNLLGENQTAGFDRYSLLVAAVGGFVFLVTYHGMSRRRRFFSPQRDRRSDTFERREEGRTSSQ